ncbi:MAG: efflux RND transporter permease subunit [Kistimonas sp.]|nr:efflux RND transporter permease subunit [Kistimonas sp.]
MSEPVSHGVLAFFVRHKVAANLVMALMILAGVWSVMHLRTQFFPDFVVDSVIVTTTWSGATADDIQRSVTLPIERELRDVAGIDRIFSSSYPGTSQLDLKISRGADVAEITNKVIQTLDGMTTLPFDAERPRVERMAFEESIARVVVSGGRSLAELRPLVRRLEQDVLNHGVHSVGLRGLPELEMAIEIDSAELHRLGLTLAQVADSIKARSLDLPAGTVGAGSVERSLRSQGQARRPNQFADLPLLVRPDGAVVRLGDVAHIRLQSAENQPLLRFNGRPAVEMTLYRSQTDDTLKSAKVLWNWVEEERSTLPESLDMVVYDENWSYLSGRLQLLLKNGITGLVLVIVVLLIFLNINTAFWVAVGIPVSLLAACSLLYLLGGSINLISLFGLIMVLGIVVDDAIVVGENILSHADQGASPERAAVEGSRRMLPPVLASSLTTMAAFFPLLLLPGDVGAIMADIPLVVICVIAVSLVECFLILPAHLSRSLGRMRGEPGPGRQRMDAAFAHFRDAIFRPFVTVAIARRGSTIVMTLCLLVLATGLLTSGLLRFTFFPTLDGSTLRAAFQMTAGSSPAEVEGFLRELDRSLRVAEKGTGERLIKHVFYLYNEARVEPYAQGTTKGRGNGTLVVDLEPAEKRSTTNVELIAAWKNALVQPPGLEKLVLAQDKAGPPGKAIDMKFTGGDSHVLKGVSEAVQQALSQYEGLSSIEDDMPWGQEQLVFAVSPQGRGLGLSLKDVGQQLRTAIDGQRLQVYHDEYEEVTVRLRLLRQQREQLETISAFPLVTGQQSAQPLGNLVDFSVSKGLDSLKRIDSQLAVRVSAEVDDTRTNASRILQELERDVLPGILAGTGVDYGHEGQSADQEEMASNMKQGLVLALVMIYIILTWIFASWSWPLVVMLTIPLGLTGALFGHWVTGQDLTVVSQLGLFGLAGIVVNDSIVLVTFYRDRREEGMGIQEAAVEAACQRLRAVLLTSITTAFGLLPMLFETSPQAKLLIPMATTIVFGLLVGTALILVVVPAMLVALEQFRLRLGR